MFDEKAPAKRDRSSPWVAVPMSDALSHVVSISLEPCVKFVAPDCIGVGRILAQDIVAVENVPSVPTSVKDGYAVLAADKTEDREVIGVSYAGSPFTGSLAPGKCVRISTGAQLPANADAVVMVEKTTLLAEEDGQELTVGIMEAPAVGADIRPPGADIKKGELLLEKGTVMGPAEIGVLLSSGWAHRPVAIYRKPKLCVLSSGNELVEATADTISLGQVRDTNRPQLMALFTDAGFKPIDAGIAGDSREQLVESIKTAFSFSNILVTTGSVSMGEKDLLKAVLVNDFGFSIHFGRVFMKPGLPCTFASGIYNDQKFLVFALPGNPVSSWVCANLFVLPSVFLTAGRSQCFHTMIRVRVTEDILLDKRPEYRRAHLQPVTCDYPEALVAGNQMSSRLMSAKGANILLELPGWTETRPKIVAGSLVDALVISRI